MKNRWIGAIAILLLLSLILFGCANGSQMSGGPQKEEPQQKSESDEKVVTQLVTDFGLNLQKVSLLAPEDLVKKSILENYGDFITEKLLSEWTNDPQTSPGRLVSSPWPDRIEILSMKKLTPSVYEVKGEIIEVTSTEKAEGGVAAKRPITLLVKFTDDLWLIDEVTIGDYEETDSIVYKNEQYAFDFTLPNSWKDYKIVNENWDGLALGAQGDKVVETGPMILIRHPKWTSQSQRQDIPIMIFTLTQWDSLQKEEYHIGAAPIGPTELGRNTKYVFALPARYNFAFPIGYEEVENISKGNALQPTVDFK